MKIKTILEQVVHDYYRKETAYYNEMGRPRFLRTVEDIVRYFDQRTLKDKSTIKILEIGTFTGIVSIALARIGYSVTATDIPEYMTDDYLQKFHDNHVETHAINLRQYSLPFENAEFDAVIICETLEHLNFNPLPVLLEINRVTKEGGLLYLTIPNLTQFKNRLRMLLGLSYRDSIEAYSKQLGKDNGLRVSIHWREYTKKEAMEMLTICGYSLLIHKYYHYQTDTAYRLLRLINILFPSFRVHQLLMATKKEFPSLDFHYSDAVQPH